MHRYSKSGKSEYVSDPWAAYEGVYPDPTDHEYGMILPFLLKYTLEDDQFVEEEDERWLNAKRNYRCPNLRAVLIEFLRQVRETKGYDVDVLVGFFNSPFVPLCLDDERWYNQGMAGTRVAITEINSQAMESGKSYKLVSLDKYVWTTSFVMLLSFTVKETDVNAMEIDPDPDPDPDPDLKTIQAMVRESPLNKYKLLEWKFKPDPIA